MSGDWVPWSAKVPQVEVETHKVASPDVVVPTLDTVRHESLLYTWLAEHKPMVLCGPPGSGKTMTLFSALRSLPDMEVVGLNFSSATTPEDEDMSMEDDSGEKNDQSVMSEFGFFTKYYLNIVRRRG